MIKEVSNLAEQVSSNYALKLLKRRNQPGFANFFYKSSDWLLQLSITWDLETDLEKLKTLLLAIQETQRRYLPLPSESGSGRANCDRYRPQFVSPLLEECLVGIDSLRSELIQSLTEGNPGLSVTSLVGAGGIGKTTLAKIVYYSEAVAQHFEFCYWITVTESCDIEEVLKIILTELVFVAEECDSREIDVMQMEEVVKILRRDLQAKRYIFVFDDVWREDFITVMRDVFPDNVNGSRIIVTTRDEAVAAFCQQGLFDRVVRLEPMPDLMSWELFCRIAFSHELDCPQELEEVSHEIVRICEGVPLAIVTMAGILLSKDKVSSEWRKHIESLSAEYCFDPHLASFSKILARSFNYLPYRLKLCFLYFAIFPKGLLIPYDKLFKLWIAEGFVDQKPGKTLEEVAEEYLTTLIHRNLVEVCEGFYGIEKFCRVSVLMSMIARREADKFNLCSEFFFGGDSYGTFFGPFYSFSLFNLSYLEKSFLSRLSEEFKLLTVLVFENVPIEHLPSEVGMLYYLKYLGLKNTLVKKLPRSIGKLVNLLTLDVRNTLLIELPIEISKLKKLQHLLASRYDNQIRLYSFRGVRIKVKIGRLQNLETLMTIDVQLISHSLIKDLAMLTRLRRLGISRLTGLAASSLCASIEKMDRLIHLSLHSGESYEILDVQAITNPPPLLEHLVLKGRLLEFPVWISSLHNLSMLCLSFSRLMDDPLPYVSSLPNLVSLWLYRAYDEEILSFEEGGFRSLKLLVLKELPGLKAVQIDEGALPLLEELRVGPCPQLEMVPSGIQYLKKLKSLAFYDMPKELVLNMQPDGGSEYWKVGQVSSVQFGFRVEGRQYVWYEIGEWDLMDHLQSTSPIHNAVQRQPENLQLSFCYSDIDSVSSSSVQWNDARQPSLSSDRFSFFTDDFEDC